MKLTTEAIILELIRLGERLIKSAPDKETEILFRQIVKDLKILAPTIN